MNSQVTVAMARSYWGALVPNDATTGEDLFIKALNVGLQRLTESGKWKGAIEYLTFNPLLNVTGSLSNGSDGYIVLPRGYAGIVLARFGCVPVPVFGQFHEWIASGPGF